MRLPWLGLVGLLAVFPAAQVRALADDARPSPTWIERQKPLLEQLGVEEAWKTTKGDPSVVVGVIDNGFDFYHPDLKGQLIPGMYYSGGYHTATLTNLAHGTLVASLIVAADDRPDGMVGLAPHCKVLTASQGMIEHALLKMRAQFEREHPNGTMADFQKEMAAHQEEMKAFGAAWSRYQIEGAAEAIRYLVDHGVRVINLSAAMRKSLCQDPKSWQMLDRAFAYAAAKNVLIVLAAGNSAALWEDYPGRPGTMLVAGACLLDGTRWEQESAIQGMKIKQGSCYGKRLSVMAPVDKLVVCVPHEARFYSWDDGPEGGMSAPFGGAREVEAIGATSSAAPIVSSLAALIYSIRPDLDVRSVVQIIEQGCDDLGAKGVDIHTGHGRVSFARSLALAKEWRR